MNYPTYDQLVSMGHTPDFLAIGACAMRGLRDAGWVLPTVLELTEAERAEYQRQHSEKRHGWLKHRFGGRRIA